MDLKDKVAIVTGGSQGIGKVYCYELAKQGANVVIADINDEKGKDLEASLKQEGYSCLFVNVNVANPDSTKHMAELVAKEFGRIDILINNAAVFSTIKMKPFEEIELNEWDLVMDVNVKGVFLCCKAVVPYMRQQKAGRIINIASDVVFSGKTDFIHYVASKSAILGFTRALAREVGDDNITANIIAPGPVFTEVQRETTTKEQDKMNLDKQCIKRPANPDDLVGIVSFLSSDQSSFITGQIVTVNGGKEMY
ncbi:dehydrogenase [Alkalihalophilus pseudofirmus]|nr:dehydrogenase [Alkalihalophilus pseudofirmus]